MDTLIDAYWKLVEWFNTWWGTLAAFAIIVTLAWLGHKWSSRYKGRHAK